MGSTTGVRCEPIYTLPAAGPRPALTWCDVALGSCSPALPQNRRKRTPAPQLHMAEVDGISIQRQAKFAEVVESARLEAIMKVGVLAAPC